MKLNSLMVAVELFFRQPRFQKEVQFIQVDICAEEFHNSVKGSVTLLGNIPDVVDQVIVLLLSFVYSYVSWDRDKPNQNEVGAKQRFI